MAGGEGPANEFFCVVPHTDAAEQKAKFSTKKADKQVGSLTEKHKQKVIITYCLSCSGLTSVIS